MTTPRSVSGAVVTRLKIMADLDIAERRVPQDGRAEHPGLRTSHRPPRCHPSLDLRREDSCCESSTRTMESSVSPTLVFFPTPSIGSGNPIKPYGAIPVTGPTGSARPQRSTRPSRSQPSQREHHHRRGPGQYRLPQITQVRVHRRAGLQFATVLKAMPTVRPRHRARGRGSRSKRRRRRSKPASPSHLVLTTLHTR